MNTLLKTRLRVWGMKGSEQSLLFQRVSSLYLTVSLQEPLQHLVVHFLMHDLQYQKTVAYGLNGLSRDK